VCYVGNRCIEKLFTLEIRDYINSQTTTNYWLQRCQLTKGIWKKINWESIGCAMREIPVNQRRWVAKYVSGHFATGKNMCRWQFRSSSQCPRCGDPQEDKNHILNCHAPEARKLWDKSLKALDWWLQDEGTDTSLREHLMDHLRSWSRTAPNPQTAPAYIAEQDEISQHNIWDGWLSKEWWEYQDRIWKQSRSRNQVGGGLRKSSRNCGT